MEILITCHPLLFDSTSLCIRCQSETEDFNHIWTCPMILHLTSSIIIKSKALLIELLEYNYDTPSIDQMQIWSTTVNSQFSFVDLIKGIVPSCLSELINSSISPRANANAILSHFMHFIFEQSQEIWKERCSLQNNFEKSNDITDQLKRSLTEDSGYHFSTSQQFADASIFINKMIRLGSHWSNFWCSRGQALFRFWSTGIWKHGFGCVRFWESAGSVLI